MRRRTVRRRRVYKGLQALPTRRPVAQLALAIHMAQARTLNIGNPPLRRQLRSRRRARVGVVIAAQNHRRLTQGRRKGDRHRRRPTGNRRRKIGLTEIWRRNDQRSNHPRTVCRVCQPRRQQVTPQAVRRHSKTRHMRTMTHGIRCMRSQQVGLNGRQPVAA